MKNAAGTFGNPDFVYITPAFTESQLEKMRDQWEEEIDRLKNRDAETFILDGAGGRFVMEDVKETSDVFQRLLNLVDDVAQSRIVKQYKTSPCF